MTNMKPANRLTQNTTHAPPHKTTHRRDLLEHLVSKGLSAAIICGSAILKVPQILAIVKSGSVVGLSLLSLYFEVRAMCVWVFQKR